MNKNKIILSAIGGVAGIAIIILGYLSYSTSSENSDKATDLDFASENVKRMNGAKIPPIEESVKAINENRDKLATWQNEALALASQGDEVIRDGLTPAAFKQEMVDDARELAKLPGGVNGLIVAENFGFGFNDIITGGSMPDQAKLNRIQRQWSEIKLFVETLSKCGVVELKSITVEESKQVATAKDSDKTKKNANKKSAKNDEKSNAPKLDTQSYQIQFLARPAAFVRVLNALGTTSRFVVVDDFSFTRESDSLAAILGGGKDKNSNANANSSRRRRRGAATQDAENGEKEETTKKGLVTDPATATPLSVTLKLSTFDFGTKADAAKESATKEDE